MKHLQRKLLIFDTLFRAKNGRVVAWQMPNAPIGGWLVFKIAALVIQEGTLRQGFEQLSNALLFVWAYLEITKGESLFRRILGVIVLMTLVVGYF